MSVYTGGGEEYLRVHQTNTLSTKLTAIILGITAIVVLYIIVRVIISFQKDQQLAKEENKRKQKLINRMLRKKNP